MTGQRTPPGGWTDDPTRTTQPSHFGRFDGLGVEVLTARMDRALAILKKGVDREKNWGWRTVIKEAIAVLEGE